MHINGMIDKVLNMKRLILIMTALVGVICGSCSANIQTEDLCGIWIQPVPGSHIVQGVELKSDGSAKSVNMATLLYDSWKLDNESIILHGLSIGNGVSGEFSDTLDIVKLTPDSLSLKKGSLVLEYARSVEDCGSSADMKH